MIVFVVVEHAVPIQIAEPSVCCHAERCRLPSANDIRVDDVGELGGVHDVVIPAVACLGHVSAVLGELKHDAGARGERVPVVTRVELRVSLHGEPAAAATRLLRKVSVVEGPSDAEVEAHAGVRDAILDERREVPNVRLLHERGVVRRNLGRLGHTVGVVAELKPRVPEHVEHFLAPPVPVFEPHLDLVAGAEHSILIARQADVGLVPIRVTEVFTLRGGPREHAGRQVLKSWRLDAPSAREREAAALRLREEFVGVGCRPVHVEVARRHLQERVRRWRRGPVEVEEILR